MQQDDSEKLLDTKFSFGADFKEQGGIDAENDDKYELLTNKNLKRLQRFFVDEKHWNVKSET